MTGRLKSTLLALMLVPALAQAGVRVELVGLDGDERKNVEARLEIRQQGDRKDLDAASVARLHDQARSDIRNALQPFGYYSPVIQAKLSGKAPDWKAQYTVDKGPPTRIGKIDIELQGEGADYAVFKLALKRVARRLKEGDRLNHANYEDTKKQLADAAYQGGFLDAHWDVNELRVNPDVRQAEVVLHLQTGPHYEIGKVTLEQTGLDPAFINRYVVLREGDAYDPQKLLDQQFALSDLGYFQSVEIEPRRAEADEKHRVPLVIHTTPRKNHRYEVGLGYGTDTGARVSIGTEWRRINSSGHNLDATARLSEIKNTAAANYRVPLGTEPNENVTFSALSESEQLEDGDTAKYTVGVSLNRRPGEWQRRLYLEFTHERSTFGEQEATADLLTPGISYTRTDADDPIFAHRGWYLFTDLHGAEQGVLASTSFVRAYVQLRGVYSFDWRTRLLGRVEVGANIQDKFSDLPASQRFFAGGDQSVRGYDYESIGTRDANGDLIGGQYLTTYSAELERRIVGNWGAAVFLDAGGADENFPPKLFYGVGAGVRYRAPVGTFQLDLAHPLTGDENGQYLGLRLHIGVRVGL